MDEVLNTEEIYSDELKRKCLTVYRQHEPDIHLYKGVVDMLTELNSSGYMIGIITDGRSEGQRAKIRAMGLERLADHIIVTDELGGIEYRKPNKLAFEKMRECIGVAYEQMCYVGDNIKKDFVSSDSLGMKSIWFRNSGGLYVTDENGKD